MTRIGHCGRKPIAKEITLYLYSEIDKHWPDLVRTIITKAVAGDKELLQYCMDRRIGKPTNKQETILKHLILSPEDLELQTRVLDFDRAAEQKLVESGNGQD